MKPLAIVACMIVLAACNAGDPDTTTTTARTTVSPESPTTPPSATSPASTTAEAWPRGIDQRLLGVDQSDVDAVGLAWITLEVSYDTRTDTNPADAMRRASIYLSPALAEHVTDNTFIRPDITWTEATKNDAYTDVSVQRIDLNPPPDTDTTKHRDYEITRSWVNDDGYEYPLEPLYISIRLSQTPSGRWQISDIA